MNVEGSNGIVELCDDRIRIRGKGWSRPKQTDIPLNEIQALDFKAAEGTNAGHIQFVRIGQFPKTGFMVLSNDPHTVSFTVKQSAAFQQFKSALETRMATVTPRSPRPSEKVIMEAQGEAGKLILLEDRIRIVREGVGALVLHGLKGDKDILLSQISSIQFQRGYIQFAFMGGQEAKGGAWEATKDENTVVFNGKQRPTFERMYSAINEQMSKVKEVPQTKAPSNLDDLEKLASLRDKGIITEDEFQLKKKQILGL